MQAYAHEAMSIIDMKYLFPKRWPSAQGDLYRHEHCKRNWILLGAYLGFWRDARVHSPIIQRAQIRRMQMYAAETHPDARCKCGERGWRRVRDAS